MKLIYSPASPFVRKTVILAHELDLMNQIELVPVATTALNTAEQAKSANPLGKIPALLRENDTSLFDSRVICRFLNDTAKGDMYPNDGFYDVLTLEALADGIMESAVSMVYEKRLRSEDQQSPDWVEAQWGKVTFALATLDQGKMPALTGTVNMGQIGVACALSYLDFRHDSRNWRQDHAQLSEWHATFCDRPSMRATEPEG